jgi:phosphoribosylformimino-5-aminoimidazole carboxamide ribotide isomerase
MAETESRMDVVPVIDLKAGQVVHARGGARDEYRPITTPLSPTSAPADVVAGLLRLFPFRRLYIADLDAIGGRGGHEATIRELASGFPGVELWVDSGAHDARAVRAWLDNNAGCLVIGSESQGDADLLVSLRADPRVILSLDFRGDSFVGPAAIHDEPDLWPERVIAMTLGRVGAAGGPDLARIHATARRAVKRQVYAAGGMRDLADLCAAAEAGAAGALVATALHQRTLTSESLASLIRT